ncbi:DUF4649 family protein [Streptococcus gallolyticus]|uniref:DUF4649 domain-containing protein n=1 Tax=Streptococcus gallolyticus TaxID=315405 RepID=A0A139R3L6_9STRE|nr:DUF4649 family protein [Streptococcus gallolyticus]KXT67557.1 hypothetical protein SGADD02_01358 [Streptococcus gallolyticus]KXU09327.1 hypothetical protein SGADD03_00870 [Streptococcus gallolyticus]
MIEITFLNAGNQERVVTFDSYEEFERSQQACSIDIADYYKVTKVVYNGHVLDYLGNYGNLFYYFLKQDLTQYRI